MMLPHTTARPPAIPTADPRLADAACAGHPHPQWWDDTVDGETHDHRQWRHHHAAAICRHCPVRTTCLTIRAELAAGPARDRPGGIWGGFLFHQGQTKPDARESA